MPWPLRSRPTREPLPLAESIQRVRVVEGDTIVFRAPHKLNMEAAKRIKDQLTELWPKNRIVVLEDGAALDVVGKPVSVKADFAERLRAGTATARTGRQRLGDPLEGEVGTY